MNYFKQLFILISFSFGTQIHGGEHILWKDDAQNGRLHKSVMLEKVLHPHKASGYAGFVPCSVVKGDHYMLFSREANNGSIDAPLGTYCEGGGALDGGETMKDALLREGYEETSRVYDFRNQYDYLNENADFCYNDWLLVAFLKVDYKPKHIFMQALAAESVNIDNCCYQEKNDFIWVKTTHLLHSLNDLVVQNNNHASITVRVLQDDGKHAEQDIILRGIFAKTLKNSMPILEKYVLENTCSIP